MISEQSLPESWRPTRRKLEQRLAETYLSLAETARVLENASIDGGMLLTESPPLVRWNQIIGRLESSFQALLRLLRAVQEDYPEDSIVADAIASIEEALDSRGRAALERSRSEGGSRSSLVGWLKSDWRQAGPCVCCLQGFSGVGKSHTAELLMRSKSFENSILVEIPAGRTSFQDTLLLISESLDRELDTRLAIGADLELELEKVLISPLLLVIDEFQNCLEPDGRPLPEFEAFFKKLRAARHRGRILLLSSQAADEEAFERVSVRTLGGLSDHEGTRVLASMLAEAGRESEVPDALMNDVVSWLGGNPRALKTLVGALRHFPLDELIELDPTTWELRSSRMSAEMISRLERQLVSKTYSTVSAESQRAMKRLSVYRRSFKFPVIEAAVGSKQARSITNELIDNFLLDKRMSLHSLNPIIREVGSTLLLESKAEYTAAHRAAASYYAGPFKADRATATRNAANFIEVRYHMMAIEDLGQFAAIATRYALHLQKIYGGKSKTPADPVELSQQIATLDGALAGGSPAADLNYYLAKLFIARGDDGDRERAAEELMEAVSLPRCPPDAWLMLIDLGQLEFVRAAVITRNTSDEDGFSANVYLSLARALRDARAGEQAIELLRDGIARISPEQPVAQLYTVATRLLVAAGRREEAIDLLRAGILRMSPEQGSDQLYPVVAKLLVASGRAEEALELLRQGIARIGPGQGGGQLYTAAAGLLAAAGEPEEALELLRQGIARIGPGHGVGPLYPPAATLLAAAGQPDEALTLLRDGITRISPGQGVDQLYPPAARLLETAGHRDEALELLRDGIARISPGQGVGPLYPAAASLLETAGHRDEALTLLRDGITRISPGQGVGPLYRAAANLLETAGQRDEALALLRESIARINPGQGLEQVYQAAAGLLDAAGRRDEALDLLRQGITRMSSEEGVDMLYSTAATLLAAAGRPEEAAELLDEGRQLGLALPKD